MSGSKFVIELAQQGQTRWAIKITSAPCSAEEVA